MNVRLLQTSAADFDSRLAELLAWDMSRDDEVERAAREILDAVRAEGDDAVLRFTERFDGLRATSVARCEDRRGQVRLWI